MISWEDEPLFDMEPETPKKNPQKKYLTWTPLRHNRFLCEECVELISTDSRNGVTHASYLREEDGGTRVYCNEHAADQKMNDQKNGKWRTKG